MGFNHWPQDLSPKKLLHVEERLIGGNIVLDILSLSLEHIQESFKGLVGNKLSNVNNVGK